MSENIVLEGRELDELVEFLATTDLYATYSESIHDPDRVKVQYFNILLTRNQEHIGRMYIDYSMYTNSNYEDCISISTDYFDEDAFGVIRKYTNHKNIVPSPRLCEALGILKEHILGKRGSMSRFIEISKSPSTDRMRSYQ